MAFLQRYILDHCEKEREREREREEGGDEYIIKPTSLA
jgi:hypothetical protein